MDMDDESPIITASDIDRLRAHIFSPVAHFSPSHNLANPVPEFDTRHAENGNDCQPQARTPACEFDVDSGLPSVVQDSEDVVHHNTPLPESSRLLSPNAFRKLRAMNIQADPSNGTQPISQSFYDSLIIKNKSTRFVNHNAPVDTQRTFEEGDSGHVDIVSSFKTREEHSEDVANSDTSDFSPVQSQQQLTQFPESQRFKTPAAVGKKRTYNGDIIDTPAPVRNPLAKDEQTTPSGVLGLSQVFAATQAASSPISNGLPTAPRSDRPSPNLEIQTRLAARSSSSPLLRPITDLRRAVTEPASRYVSVRQSQAERERLERLQLDQSAHNVHEADDGFDEDDSVVARKRRQKDRENKARQELKSLSSPLMPPQDLPTSSPLKLPSEELLAIDNGDILAAMGNEPADPLSEAETEPDDTDTSPRRSSQVMMDEDEDKENTAVLVPKTAPRRKAHLEHMSVHVDASPLLRRTGPITKDLGASEMQSSEPFRIMDSQPSDDRSRSTDMVHNVSVSVSDTVDLLQKTSQDRHAESSAVANASAGHNCYSPSESHQRVVIRWPEDEIEVDPTTAKSTASKTQPQTVQETNSDARVGVPSPHSAVTLEYNTDKESTLTSRTNFETAQTHVGPQAPLRSSQISSPVRATPPGRRRRRRMMEISAEPSPRKLHSQPGFDARAVLQLDDDEEAAEFLESSPYRTTTAIQRSPVYRTPSDQTTPVGLPYSSSKGPGNNDDGVDGPIERVTEESVAVPIQSPDVSQEVVRPGRHNRSQLTLEPQDQNTQEHQAPRSSAVDRTSIFDIQGSPQELTRSRLRLKPRPRTAALSRNTQEAKNTHSSLLKVGLQQSMQEGMPSHTISHKLSELGKSDGGTLEIDNCPNPILSEPVIASEMVLAYYKGDPRGYYPAKVLGNMLDDRYQIQWQGYDPVYVDAFGIKALDLRIGDSVKILAAGFAKIPYTVLGFRNKLSSVQDTVTDIRGYKTLIVAPKQRKSLSHSLTQNQSCEVLVASIYLDANMWAQMKQRDQEFRPVTGPTVLSGTNTPAYRASTPSTPSTKGRRQTIPLWATANTNARALFKGMAFAISYDDVGQKNQLSNLINANGGNIINDSFHDLLDADTLQLKPSYADFGFTALLTDRHSRKEKYMQALALGLPCLSGKWVEACVNKDDLQDWPTYLLPAGESAELDNITRSRILPPINMKAAKLSDMLASRPCLFAKDPVIVVVGRGKGELKRAPYLFLIQALGAGEVHRVSDIKSAKEFLQTDRGKQCRWTFVDDKDVTALQIMLTEESEANRSSGRASKKKSAPSQVGTQCRVAGNELIVQSLILGRLYDG